MTYQVPDGLAVTATKAKTAKGELSQIAKGDSKAILHTCQDGDLSCPVCATKGTAGRDRELMAIPRDENGWRNSLVVHHAGLAMVARRENSVQRIDHHNLGLVPADGDDVAQEAVTQAMAMRAVAQLRGLDLEDTEQRLEARAIAVATLDATPTAELEAELAELQAPRYEFTSSEAFRKTSYKRATADLEAFIEARLKGDELAQFRKLFATQQPTAGEALRERHHVHKRLNAKAMKMVRGMNQFGRWVDAEVADYGDAQSLFDTTTVEESPEEARRAKLAIALGKKVKRGNASTQGLMLLLELAGYKLVTKAGKVQFHKDGRAKLTKVEPKSIEQLEAEHGWDFFQKAKRDATTFMAQVA